MSNMSWIDDELAEFGRRIGIDRLRLDAAGACQLRLPSGDTLALEISGDEVVIYRSHRAPWTGGKALNEALRRNNQRAHGQPLQVGLRGSGAEACLVVAQRLPARQFTAQRLEQTWDGIGRWLDDWRSAG